MRDIAVTLMFLSILPMVFRHAYVGVLLWSWVSYMNPHRMCYGFAYGLPFAMIAALVLLISFVASKEKQPLPVNATVCVWLVFIAWMLVTTLNAVYFDRAMEMYIRILKIQLMTFIGMMLITDEKKLTYLLWVIVISIGFFSTKGGVFTLLTGGSFRVYGPPTTNIEENNALAVATLMVIPIMLYLYRTSANKWIRYGLMFSIVASIFSAIGSQSRGAMLAMISVGFFFWLKSKTKLFSGALVVICAGILVFFMPQSWHDRMSTTATYEEDVSAMSRINSWKYSINIANDNLTGGGLESWSPETFAIYAPRPEWVYVAHSIYFSVVADHGWPGLLMFLLVLALTWRSLSGVIKRTHNVPDSKANILARMLQISLIAYMTGGAFLSLSYFDLPWHIISIAAMLSVNLEKLYPPDTPNNTGKGESVLGAN